MTDNSHRDKFWQFVGQTSDFQPSLEVSAAEGSWIIDTQGRKYLDFISGIAVTNLGHSHPEIVAAVQKQAATYAHTMVYGEHVQAPQVELAEAIAGIAPDGMDAVYFLTTGSEANDAALKMAAKHTGRARFLAFNQAYHGDTAGALSCFGSAQYRQQFTGLLANVAFIPYNQEGCQEAIDESIAAVIVEPVQGEGGIRPPAPGFLEALRERCDSVGALLIFDEVQTGFGRTGEWFAAQTYSVTPDIITMAKGMGAGYPLAGVLASREKLHAFAAKPAFSHITTFGGHPVSCAAGLAALQIMQRDDILANVKKQGNNLVHDLTSLMRRYPQIVREVRGVGLMIGLETPGPEIARQIVERCREKGLILETTLLHETTVRFSPALNITSDERRTALEILNHVLAGFTKSK